MLVMGWMLLVACRPEAEPAPGDPGQGTVDLVGPVAAGSVVAGLVTDDASLFGGIAAEGRIGDAVLRNDRARFVVQGLRDGNFYLVEGGGVIDADIARPDGQPGRDIVEEWSPMFGFGRMMYPETIDVVSNGNDGMAVVRLTGYEVPLGLIEGALEAPGFVPDMGLEMEVEYRLAPDSPLLEVRTVARATDREATLALGDALFGTPEVADRWAPGIGLDASDSGPITWSAYVSHNNEVAVALVAAKGETMSSSGFELLSEAADMVLGFGETVTLQPGDSFETVRYYAVGPDLATISDAVHTLNEADVDTVEGEVTAPDGPVPGARVAVMVDGAPYTMAVTDGDGAFSATVPAGATVETLAIGRGRGLFLDLPEGAPPMAAYPAPGVRDRQLQALADGALPVPRAQGRGVGTASDPLVLGEPAELIVRSDDGMPFEVQVAFTEADAPVDEAVVLGRPHGLAAAGWARDGEVRLWVEPGTYDVLVHRGLRYELHQEQVTVAPDSPVTVQASLDLGFDHSGWLMGDPHMHASPSSDGEIPMEERLVAAAGVGIQLHFGTDHDHVADYRPLLAPLGLEGVLASIVADEVSPPIRGHFNSYPLEPVPELPNQGAWAWWLETPESTDDLGDRLRERHGDDVIIQANHPTDSGVADSASWSVGEVDRPDFWMSDLQAVEVDNAGDVDEFLEFWLDIVLRGSNATPVGVSDSHSHFGGDPGINATFFGFGVDDPMAVDNELLKETVRSGRTIVSRGAYLVLSVDPGSTVAAGTTVDVVARSSSWVQIDRVLLFENGVELARFDGTEATFLLTPAADALYTIVAEGDVPMLPVSNELPWAMSNAIYVDVDGDGWDPPLPPLVFGSR